MENMIDSLQYVSDYCVHELVMSKQIEKNIEIGVKFIDYFADNV